MQKPMTAKQATELLYDVYGTDELFDRLDRIDDINPKQDVRPTIADQLEDDLEANEDPMRPREVEKGYDQILRKIVRQFSPNR